MRTTSICRVSNERSRALRADHGASTAVGGADRTLWHRWRVKRPESNVPSPPRAQSDSCGPRGGRLRTLLRRIVVAHVVVFTFMACVLGCGYWYERAKLDEIRRVRDLVLQRATSGRPVNFLIIGSDSRSFVHSPIDVAHFGTFSEHGGQRADTMMVVRIDPRSKRTFIVSFPRDLWVDIPGHGRAKINDAFNWGAQAVIDTLRADFGVRVNHYLEV